MIPTENVSSARERGLFAFVDGNDPAVVLANLGALHVTGTDATEFLHGQVTNDVKGLKVGSGNLSARVKRTGHLVEIFSLHRLTSDEDGAEFFILGERHGISRLIEDLDAFLFVEDVVLDDVSDDYGWFIVQGPASPQVFNDDEEPAYRAGEIRSVDGGYRIARSLTGDPGFICAIPRDGGGEIAFSDAALEVGLDRYEGSALGEMLEVLRLEAGFVRVSVDTPEKARLLPETGLEQQLVSYTKGCYLGQEVIARVRTYGSVPHALRGLVLQAEGEETSAELLGSLPDAGQPLVVGGKTRGQFLSRFHSPTLDSPLVWAYVHRDHRTPGNMIEFECGGRTMKAKVVLLPVYRPLDELNRVPDLYDRAIRRFAEGDVAESVELLEEVLRIDPTFADAYEAVGVIFGRSGKFHEAIDVFQRLAEVVPDEPMVDTNLSLYFMKLGDKARAEDYSAKALQKNMAKAAGSSVTAAAMAASQSQQRKNDALRKKGMFEQVLAFDPEDSIALFGAGNALFVLEDWEGAADYLQRASAADKNNAAVFLAHGKALEKLERGDEALAVFKAGMDVASRRGDLMPLNEMVQRVLLLEAMNS